MGSTDVMLRFLFFFQYVRDDIQFLDLIIHNPTNLMIDGVTHAVEIDPCGPANYIFNNSGLEK